MATNTFVLEGIVISRDALRTTPGGTAALNLTLKHESQQREGTQDVTVEIEINAVAFGEVAEALDALKPDDNVSLKGFLSRKNRFSPAPILHITQFKIVK
ncbi:MAG TPA: primosomal replication protein N [Usitatibacteraceae bacterium]